MTAKLHAKLESLMRLPAETEWVEFKEAKTAFDFEKLGVYFSALSNEANLKGQPAGWLVFGVTDTLPRQVVGTQYKSDRPSLDALKKGVADQTNCRLTFEEIHELHLPAGRVLMFQIPPALRGMPTTWKGHDYGRESESLGALNPRESEIIRSQAVREDWSAGVVEGASLSDLDPRAIEFSRVQYREKHPTRAAEAAGWDDSTFLNKARVCIDGRMTRAALLLLGREESAHFLAPAEARITWVVRDAGGADRDYQHFDPPLILASDRVLAKVRNLTVRKLPSGTLFPVEVTQYDTWVMRESLHNCIAHQDYSLGGKITLVEAPDSLLFTNLGSFLPGAVEEVIRRDAPPEVYRNGFLARAMESLNMIDTIGSGIKRMFLRQRERSFPMPDYDLSDPSKVSVRLAGRVLDENYTRQLLAQPALDLTDAIALDQVQKKRPLDDATTRRLRARGLVEGRRPNLFVSAKVAAATGDKATYIRNRAFDRAHYREMVVAFLRKFGAATRQDIEKLLQDKLSDTLDARQKRHFVMNLLQGMRREGLIRSDGSTRGAMWVLHKPLPKRET